MKKLKSIFFIVTALVIASNSFQIMNGMYQARRFKKDVVEKKETPIEECKRNFKELDKIEERSRKHNQLVSNFVIENGDYRGIEIILKEKGEILKERKSLYKKNDDLNIISLKGVEKDLSKKLFLSTANRFIEKSKGKIGGISKNLKVGCNNYFIQNLEVDGDVEIKVFGDIHSDAGPLRQFLGKMVKGGWVEKNNNFKLKQEHKNKYLVFLGDYIDRGTEGVEVLYSIMSLFIHNPDNVILIRGNHEFEDNYLRYGFVEELEENGVKYSGKIKRSALLVVNKIYISGNLSKNGQRIKSIFNWMPSALFFVQKNKNKKRSFLFTHGGPAFNKKEKHFFTPFIPVSLLKSEKNIFYENIGSKISDQFAWNDFLKDSRAKFPKYSERGVGYVLSKVLLNSYAKEFTKQVGYPLVGIVRGHQQGSFKKEFESYGGIHLLDSKEQLENKENKNSTLNIKELTKQEPFAATVDFFRYAKYGSRGTSAIKDNAVILELNLKKDFEGSTLGRTILFEEK